jgi:hypothetical protein
MLTSRLALVAVIMGLVSVIATAPADATWQGNYAAGGYNPASSDSSTWPTSGTASGNFPASTQYIRLWDSGVTWANIEPQGTSGTSNVTWDWTRLDQLVIAAAAKGLGIDLVLGQTPLWAAPSGSTTNYTGGSAGVPKNIYDWNLYVSAVATRYAGYNMAYEIWNEPNLGLYWSGDMSVMAYLQKQAFGDIRLHAPNAKVLTPGFTSAATSGTNPPFTQFLNSTYAPAANSDAVAFHDYPTAASQISSVAGSFESAVKAKTGGADKPLWLTELGCDKTTVACTSALAQSFVNTAKSATDVQVLLWYPLAGTSTYFGYNEF